MGLFPADASKVKTDYLWRRAPKRLLATQILGIAMVIFTLSMVLLTNQSPVKLGKDKLQSISVTELAPNTTTGGINIDVSASTQEVGEVNASTGRSSWWKYTATSSYSVTLVVAGLISDISSCVTTTIGSCSVATNSLNGSFTYALTAGTTYYFRFAANGDDRGTFTLSRGTYVDGTVPGNDAFASATTINELASGTDTGILNYTLTNASSEAGEAAVTGTAKSIWWKYTPTATQVINVITKGWTSNVASCVTTAIGSCSIGSASTNGVYPYSFASGTTYYIRLNPNGTDLGSLMLSRAGSDNDSFANATTIPELSAGTRGNPITVDVSQGTIEPGEVSNGLSRSRWWKYTPTSNSLINVEFRAGGSLLQCITTVISSCSLGSAGTISTNNFVAGTTYYIRISKATLGSNDGVFTLARGASDNDSFANATVIPELTAGTSSTPATVDVSNATVEVGETQANSTHSRWWKYTPTSTQAVEVVTGSSGDLATCVTTSISSCTEGSATNGAFPYTFTSGTIYYIRVSGFNVENGYLFISRGGAGNDNFANATNVPELASGASTTIGVDLRDATVEPGEVSYGLKKSKWWKYTPSVATTLSVTVASASSFGSCITRTAGVCEQAQNGGTNGIYGAALVAGTTYYIRVASNPTETGTIVLSRDTGDNDNFANATNIPELAAGTSTSPILFNAAGATEEAGEAHYGQDRSRWWKYTPTTTGSISIASAGSSSGIAMCVGLSISSCSLWQNGGVNSVTAIAVTANTTYYLRVSDYVVSQGSFTVYASNADNDLMANATTISEVALNASSTPVRVDLSNAAMEPTEYAFGDGKSRWWKYTPTSSYTLNITTLGPRNITKCVTLVISSCSVGSNSSSGTASFSLTSGTTYFIRIDSYGAERGWLYVSRGTPPAGANPSQDSFASAVAIGEVGSGNEFSTAFDLGSSTSEGGEVAFGGSKSQWWSYTPTTSYELNVSTFGPGGSVAMCVTTSISLCSVSSSLVFGTFAVSLTAGTTYYLRVSDNSGTTGAFTVLRSRTDNDRFASATSVTELSPGSRFSAAYDFGNATIDSGEVAYGGERSLWWKYTTTSAQVLNLAASTFQASSYLCVTTAIGSCSVGSSTANPYSVSLSASTTYYFRVSVNYAFLGTFSVSRAAATGDLFSDATNISELSSGTSVTGLTADLTTGTVENGETGTSNISSFWWKYTPTSSYSVTLTVDAAYTPSVCMTTSIASCSVGSQNFGAKAYSLTAGTTYYIRVASTVINTVTFALARGGASNDDFGNATSITELSAGASSPITMFDNSNATAEGTELASTLGKTSWWKYTPSSSYTLVVTSFSHYNGNDICVTTSIASCTVGTTSGRGQVAYALTGATTYYLRMSSSSVLQGAFMIARTGASNDEISGATNIAELADGARTANFVSAVNSATTDVGFTSGQRTLWWKYAPTANQVINADISVSGGTENLCVTTTTTSCSVASTSTGRTAYALTAGTTYYFGTGLNGSLFPAFSLSLSRASSTTNDAFSNATAIRQYDITAPTSGSVFDGTNTGVEQSTNGGSLNQLSANWPSFSDAGSGISFYEYEIGTSPLGSNVQSWTTTSVPSVTVTGLSLSTSVTYYFSVRATDGAGNISTITVSPGQQVTPMLSFSVAGVAATTACGDVSTTAASSSSSASYGSIPGGSPAIVGAALSVSTNAAYGYVVTVKAASAPASSAGRVIAGVSGTNASPSTWPTAGTEGFGYATSSSTLSGTAARFRTGLWAAISSNPGEVMRNTVAPTSTENACVAFGLSRSAITPAGTYGTTVIFTAVPTF